MWRRRRWICFGAAIRKVKRKVNIREVIYFTNVAYGLTDAKESVSPMDTYSTISITGRTTALQKAWQFSFEDKHDIAKEERLLPVHGKLGTFKAKNTTCIVPPHSDGALFIEVVIMKITFLSGSTTVEFVFKNTRISITDPVK